MYVIATFKHSKKIEIALADLKNSGLDNNKLLALPLNNKASSMRLLDSKNKTDRESLIDIAAILGMIFMLLGGIYGFVLKWGPIIWGLIGLIIGFTAGLAIKFYYLFTKQNNTIHKNYEKSEIVLIINCEHYQEDSVKQILWENDALGMVTFENECVVD